MILLDVADLTRRFGGVLALNGASFSIDEGEIISLIGPNGSGKTTFFNCLTGINAISPVCHHMLSHGSA